MQQSRRLPCPKWHGMPQSVGAEIACPKWHGMPPRADTLRGCEKRERRSPGFTRPEVRMMNPERPLSGHNREVRPSSRATTYGRWSKMCYERWMRRKTRREERLDDELRHLLDEEHPRPEPREPVVEHERDEEPRDPERVRVEAGTRS